MQQNDYNINLCLSVCMPVSLTASPRIADVIHDFQRLRIN